MSIIKNTVQVWAPNEQVTAAKLNDVIAEAVFDTGAVAAGGEIVVNSLGELEIPDGSLNAGKLANNAVETNKINALAVNNAKIADGAVTPAKLSTGKPTWDTQGNLTTGGNVIRTLNVTQKEDNGHLRLWGSTLGNGSFIQLYGGSHSNHANVTNYNADEHRFRDVSGSPERMRITSSGDVGIGTTNPAAKLHVNGNIITSSGGLIRTHGGVEEGNAVTPHYSFVVDTNTGMFRAGEDDLGFATNGVGRLRIKSNGNIGIGTNAPGEKLEVVGSVKATSFKGNLNGSDLAAASVTSAKLDPTTVSFLFRYESAEQSIPGNGNRITLNHGLAATPKLLQVILRCKTANLGWSVGDEIVLPGIHMISNNHGFTTATNATQIKFAQFGEIYIHQFNTDNQKVATITANSWRLVFRAWE